MTYYNGNKVFKRILCIKPIYTDTNSDVCHNLLKKNIFVFYSLRKWKSLNWLFEKAEMTTSLTAQLVQDYKSLQEKVTKVYKTLFLLALVFVFKSAFTDTPMTWHIIVEV